MRITKNVKFIRILVTFGSFMLAGCAMEQRGSHLHFRTDLAEFGEVVDRFQLADGSEGKLRRDFTGKYSIKLSKYLKVIPLTRSPGMARIVYSGQVRHQTAVLIETSSNDCKHGYQLYAFVGNDVSTWEVGNCTVPARVFAEEDRLFIDFERGTNVRRYMFADNKLNSANLPASAIRPVEARVADSAEKRKKAATASDETQGLGQTTASGNTAYEPAEEDTNQAVQDEIGPSNSGTSDAKKGRHIPSLPIASGNSSSAPGAKSPPEPSLSKNQQAKRKNARPVIPDLVFGEREEKPARVIVLTD